MLRRWLMKERQSCRHDNNCDVYLQYQRTKFYERKDIMPLEAKFSEYALRTTNSIAEEPEAIEGKSEWLKNDLSTLIQLPIAVQLKAILGSESAESFLHPTIKDQKKVKLNARFQISKKLGSLDAHQLWNNLRASSENKLTECCITNYHKRHGHQGPHESKLLGGIMFSRHRTDLMHRVSRMNRNKTKEMMKDFFLPSFDDDFSDLIQTKKDTSSPLLHLSSKPTGDMERVDVEKNTYSYRQRANSKIKFVSEDDCRCTGNFRERLQDQGVIIKTGISMEGNHLHKSNSMYSIKKTNSENSAAKKASKSAEDEAKDLYNRLNNILNERRESEVSLHKDKTGAMPDTSAEDWEPLTIEALVQQGKKTFDVSSVEKWYMA